MITITVTGRLTDDPHQKDINGKKVVSFGIASRSFGPSGDTTIFIDVNIWGPRSNAAVQYMKKGDTVTVCGKLLPVKVYKETAYLKMDAYDFTLPIRSNNGQTRSENLNETPDVEEDMPF